MSEELVGNVLIAQAGGPTSVINSSLAGVISESLNHECIEEIYGARNGVLGLLKEDFIDLAEESQQTIRALRYTPGAALGTCRYKLSTEADFERAAEVFQAHNIRYFFYVGGNDSQDTANKLYQAALKSGHDMRVIGIPKTIDNDLPVTDHCPGYGSVIKYIATTVREMALDHAAMGQHDLVSIVEVMGRNAGWITAGATLAKPRNRPEEAPHLIYLPEVAFDKERFLADVREVLKVNKFCMVVASEGLVDGEGNYVATSGGSVDSFGHAQLGGVGEILRCWVEQEIGIKARACKLGTNQRAAAHCSSKTDNDEAHMCGTNAVIAAINGHTGKMITLIREQTNEGYTSQTGLILLDEVANGVKTIPAEWIDESGNALSHPFVKYALPLIQGEVELPYEFGLPKFAEMANNSVEKKLSHYALA